MRTKLIIRGDGSQSMGLGHLFRLMALWDILALQDKTFAISASTDENLLPETTKRLKLPADLQMADEPTWLAKAFSPTETSIVTDGYQFDTHYLKALVQLGFRVICIDDLLRENNPAQVIINHAIGITAFDYKGTALNQFGLGTKFAMLRPTFLKAAGKPRELSDSEAAFICFGGADPNDLSLSAVKALLELKPNMPINVVLGAAYQHVSLDALVTQHKNVALHRALSETQLADLMLRCTFGMVSASTIAYEACAIQMPLMAGYYVDNQKKLYQGLVAKGLVVGAGDISQFEANDFKRMFVDFLSRSQTQVMKAQAAQFDTLISQRINWLFNDIYYRAVTADDVRQVYDWANDPLIRANSYQSDTIAFEEHQAWFSSKLKDKNCLMYICMYQGQAAGMLRYQVNERNAVVGIQIGEGFRGKKLAVPMLVDTARFYFRQFNAPIFAYIKVENEASKNAFEKAGYKYQAQEVVSGYNSFCYRLDKVDV